MSEGEEGVEKTVSRGAEVRMVGGDNPQYSEPMAAIYYSGPNRQQLTADESDLPGLLASGAVSGETLVWKEGMADWQPLRVVRPDLAGVGAARVGPPPLRAAGAAHEIDYELFGSEMQIVEIELDPGETVIAEAGSMNYMDSDIRFETKMGDGTSPTNSFWDKMKQVGKRALTGESLFMTHFTNQGSGKKRVAFAAPYPGKIIPLELREWGGEIICQKDSFLCAAMGTQLGIAFAQRLGTGLFGGEGFVLQKINGEGRAFIHAGGHVMKKELKGETLIVDTGCLVAFTKGIEYNIQRAGNLKSMVFGGEGLFVATLRGHGTVLLQSLPFSRLADRVLANSAGSAKNDQGSIIGGLGNLFGD
jgi:uncharacterized protein (TIGR00266 family)